MRQLGTLPTQDQTRRLVDYLLTEGIATRAEEDGDDWLIWVISEDDFERARHEFADFQASPESDRYQGREQQAEELRAEKRARVQQAKENLTVVRSGAQEPLSAKARRIPITFALILICVATALWTSLGDNANSDFFHFVSERHQYDNEWNPQDPVDATVDVRNGQIWRLVSPIFLHLGGLHLLFNMMWFYQLGGQIEMRKGRVKYLLLILALAVFSNLVQVYVSRYPFFGGMSGVVYGLFGYIWMKSRFDPTDRLFIHPSTVTMMMIWFVICFAPGMNVANGGHGGGLALGAAIGYLSSQMRTG